MQNRGDRKGYAKNARDLAFVSCILSVHCVIFLRALCARPDDLVGRG
jgi:hypothetical protein